MKAGLENIESVGASSTIINLFRVYMVFDMDFKKCGLEKLVKFRSHIYILIL